MDSQTLEQVQGIVTTFGIKIIAAIAVLIVGRWVAVFLKGVVKRLMVKSKTDETIVSFVGSLVYIGLMTFVAIAALGQLGIQTTSFIAVIGAAGLAIGLALQGSLSNFAAGFLLILFKPFKAGDFIEGAGTAGVVEKIQIFTTQLRTGDNKTIIVPNTKLSSDNIVNISAKPTRRVDMVFGIGYGDDIDKAKGVIADVLAQDNRILNDPATVIAVLELADSSVNIAVRPWVKSGDYWNVYCDTLETMKKRFDAEGINIPYPQRDVHLYEVKN